MKRVIKIKLLILIPALICPWLSFADLPVIDPVEIHQLYQQFKQLQKQYDVLNHAYKTARDQLNTAQQELGEAKHLVGDAEGHYGMVLS